MKLLATITLLSPLVTATLNAEEAITHEFASDAQALEMLSELRDQSAARDLASLQQKIKDNPELESQEVVHSIERAQDKLTREMVIQRASIISISDENSRLRKIIQTQEQYIELLTETVAGLEDKIKELTDGN